MGDSSLHPGAPPDKYNLVYITFLIHGVVTLLPWNTFVTAYKYFTDYKLGIGYIGYDFPYLGTFMQVLTFSQQIPNVVFNWMNIFVPLRGEFGLRIVYGLLIFMIVFIITIILAMVDTTNWAYGFYFSTMLSVIIINVATGVYLNTLFGMTAQLPPKYTGAVVLGNNVCGTLISIVSIASVYIANDIKMSAIYYFIAALFVVLIGFNTFYALPLNRYYRYFELKEKKRQDQKKDTDKSGEKIPLLQIWKKSFVQQYNVGFIFFVTLAVFPAVHADVVKSPSFFIQDDFLYQQILCFLTFNVFATVGAGLSSIYLWPSKDQLWIPVTLRVLYIPFYLFCNYHPYGVKRTMPVLITNDYIYWIGAATMAFTSGYWSAVSMMYAPSTVEGHYAWVAGMFEAAAFMSGIFAGILVSFLWPWLVSHVG